MAIHLTTGQKIFHTFEGLSSGTLRMLRGSLVHGGIGVTLVAERGDVFPAEATVERRSYGRDFRETAVELWQFREMLYQLTLRDIRIRYKQAVLGFGWALFMPVMVVAAGCLIRFLMLRAGRAGAANTSLVLATLATLAIKSLGWSYFVGAIGAATGSLTANIQLVTKVYFPRAVLPLAATLAHYFDLLIGVAVLALILPFLRVEFSAALLWVPALLLLLFGFTLAAALFLSCANLFYRDVKYIVQILLTFGIFFTPVFFEPSMLGARLARLSMWNPLAPILEGLRLSIVEGHNLLTPLLVQGRHLGVPETIVAWSPAYLAYAVAFTMLALVGSATLFHRSEFRFAEAA